MRAVWTYTDIRSLDEAPCFDQVCGLPMITTSSELSSSIYSVFGARMKYRPIGFRKLMLAISPRWDTESDWGNMISLASEYFRERMSATEDEGELDWLGRCSINKKDLISNVVLLTEAGIQPDDVQCEDKDVKLLVDLWSYISDNSTTIRELNAGIESMHDARDAESVISRMFGNTGKTLILHGFYFITPLQERIFTALESCGYSLVMLIHYNMRHPYANAIWRSTMSEAGRYAPTEEWNVQESESVNSLGELFEGNRSASLSGVRINAHDTVLDLIRDVSDSRKDGYCIYSADDRCANDLIRDYFLEEYDDLIFMTHPIGQFIRTVYGLHVDPDKGPLIDADVVQDCFSTGWASAEGHDSRDYVSVFRHISPYFQGCATIPEWESRLGGLLSVYSDVLSKFGAPEPQDRWSRLMSNPLSAVGPFSVGLRTVHIIGLLLKHLFSIIRLVYGPGTKVTIREHLEDMKSVMGQALVSNPGLEDDYKRLDIVINRLSGETNRFLPCDMRDAIASFLDESTDEYEGYKSESTRMVKSMRRMEAVRLVPGGKVHIVLSDIDRLPGGKREYVWPLTKDIINAIRQSSSNGRFLGNLEHIMQSTPLVNRYLTYAAFDNESVILSWVRNLDTKCMQPSPFIKLLSCIGNVGISEVRDDGGMAGHPDGAGDGHTGYPGFDIRSESYVMADEAKRDYALCPLRYLYGYVLQDHPMYDSPFHIQFVASNAIGAFRSLCPDIEPYEIEQAVLSLFPNMTDIEKKQARDYVYSEDAGRFTAYRGHEYTEGRYRIDFPNYGLLEAVRQAFGALYTKNGRRGLMLDCPTEVKGACMYCAHSAYCRRVVHSIDQEDHYGC